MFPAIISGYRFLYLQLASLLGYGWAIVALSFVCSLLMLPLMRAVAGVVRREKEYEDVVDPQIAAIKAKYASDMERHFHIQRLYARYGYSPLSPIKKVCPLFVQIPFLLLTYYMLKGTAQLSGVSFLFLADLGRADALLPHSVNLLPLAMTGVNILTVFATPGFSHKDWTQAIGISLLFLVLLYTAPSALLLYWTLNNVLTFLRTLLEKDRAGAQLLLSRCALMPRMIIRFLNPMAYWRWLDTRSCTFFGYAAYALVLLAVYMHVLASYLAGGWRNWYVAFYLQDIVLAGAVYCTYRAGKECAGFGRLSRSFFCFNAMVAGVVALANLALDATIPFTGKYMRMAAEVFPLMTVFRWLFSLWAVSLLLNVRPHSLISALRKGWKENAFLLVLPVALAIHYAFSSANFKLQTVSVVMLCGYMLLPCVTAALLAMILFDRLLPEGRVARIAIGVVIGMWLLPMVSVENGLLFGYGFNFPIRLLVLVTVPLMLLRIKSSVTGAVFVSLLSLALLFNAWSNRKNAGECAGLSVADTTTSAFNSLVCVKTNNVYLLVYDSYPHQIVMDALGLDGHQLQKYLSDHGFKGYSAYSEGCDTIGSMAAMFEIGGVTASRRASMAGNNPFCEFLKRSGYRTNYMLCGYSMPAHGEPLPGDFYFPSPAEVTRPEMVLFPWIVRGCLTQLPNVFNRFSDEERVRVKRQIMSEMVGRKSFLYSHCPWPEHAPVSVANRAEEATILKDFQLRLDRADREMREDVRLIVAQDPDALVVIASDHGGILVVPETPGKYDARHLLDRCGIQLFIRWPKDYQPVLALNCLQNVWLEVLIYMTGERMLAKYKRAGVTQPVTYPVKAPAGIVRGGVIQEGDDRGKSLFEAARERFVSSR